MRFKLSVRELEILDKDRIKILKKLRKSHLDNTSSKQSKSSTKKKPMKPPILLVPLDDSRLFCIIQTCTEYDEIEEASKEQEEIKRASTSNNECCKNSKQRKTHRKSKRMGKARHKKSITIEDKCSDNQSENKAAKNVPTAYDQIFPANFDVLEVPKLDDDCSICGKARNSQSFETSSKGKNIKTYFYNFPKTITDLINSICNWVEKRRSANTDSQERDEQAKVNELRMAEELALGAMTGAIPVLSKKDMDDHNERLSARETKRRSPFYQELEPILTLKCDVCVLSTYKQIFLFMDVLLKTRLWSTSIDEIQQIDL